MSPILTAISCNRPYADTTNSWGRFKRSDWSDGVLLIVSGLLAIRNLRGTFRFADDTPWAGDFRRTLCEILRGPLGTHQMLSLRSLAFILASAIRRSRALSCAALHRSPDRISISGRKIAANMAAKMTTMSISCEQFYNFLGSVGTSRRSPTQKTP